MFFIARSAVCIAIVVTSLPNQSHDSLRDLAAAAGRAASGQVQSVFDRAAAMPRRHSDLAGGFDIGQLASALDPRPQPARDRGDRSRGRGLPTGLLATLKPAAAD